VHEIWDDRKQLREAIGKREKPSLYCPQSNNLTERWIELEKNYTVKYELPFKGKKPHNFSLCWRQLTYLHAQGNKFKQNRGSPTVK